MVRKHWPMTKVNSMFMEVARDMPAVRISAGWISAGTSQPRGPANGFKLRFGHEKFCKEAICTAPFPCRNRKATSTTASNGPDCVSFPLSSASKGLPSNTSNENKKLTPTPGKVGHVEADGCQNPIGHAVRQGAVVVAKVVAQADAHNDLAGDHADAGGDEQEAAADAVDTQDGNEGGNHIYCRARQRTSDWLTMCQIALTGIFQR